MPVPAGSHDDNALQQIMKYIPTTSFNVNQIANDGDCTSCVVVSESALSIHERGPIFDQLLVKGELSLPGIAELRRLPRLLAVTGSLDLSGCSRLSLMPESLYVGGSADLSGTPIETLSAQTVVGGNLNIAKCVELLEVHEGVSCHSLDAEGCTNLKLIAGKRSYRSLDLSGTAIEELPPGLEIETRLILRDCKFLTSIPEGTTTKNAVDVTGCSALFRLPKSLQPTELKFDTFIVSPSGLHTPHISKADAEMMVGRPAREVIHHHLLENLEVMKATILDISTSKSRTPGSRSFVTLATHAKRQQRELSIRRLPKRRN